MDGGGAEADGLTGDVLLDDVSFGYDANEVLSGVDLTFRAGHITALTGHTGAGKSTVLNLLLRFENPQSGRDPRRRTRPRRPERGLRTPTHRLRAAGVVVPRRHDPGQHRARRPPGLQVPMSRRRRTTPSSPGSRTGFRRGSTRASASPGCCSPVASASGWRSPGPSYDVPTCSCSTSPPRTRRRGSRRRARGHLCRHRRAHGHRRHPRPPGRPVGRGHPVPPKPFGVRPGPRGTNHREEVNSHVDFIPHRTGPRNRGVPPCRDDEPSYPDADPRAHPHGSPPRRRRGRRGRH